MAVIVWLVVFCAVVWIFAKRLMEESATKKQLILDGLHCRLLLHKDVCIEHSCFVIVLYQSVLDESGKMRYISTQKLHADVYRMISGIFPEINPELVMVK